MFDYLYKWMQNIACYMVLITALLQVLPSQEYKKYIRFFTGLILIILLVTPVLKLFGIEKDFSRIYAGKEYENTIREIEDSTRYLENIDSQVLEEYQNKEEETKNSIEIGEVQIGR